MRILVYPVYIVIAFLLCMVFAWFLLGSVAQSVFRERK